MTARTVKLLSRLERANVGSTLDDRSEGFLHPVLTSSINFWHFHKWDFRGSKTVKIYRLWIVCARDEINGNGKISQERAGEPSSRERAH